MAVYARLEPLLSDVRRAFGPNTLANLEKLVENTNGARERVAAIRERWHSIRAELASRSAAPVS